MPNEFSETIDKIVENYLNRFKQRLKSFPEQDRDELVKEIHSHIYESFKNDPTENEVERIFIVLDKLGEPDDVVASRMPDAMMSMGKKKKRPLYILAGVFIALFGLPLGLGGVAVLFGFIITLLALIFSYYLVAFSLVLAGWIGAIVSVIRIINPYFLDSYIEITSVVSDPTLNGIITLSVCLITAAMGILLFWFGRYIMRGFKYLVSLPFEKIKEIKRKRRLNGIGKAQEAHHD
ncbi:hypothetical protein ACFLQZ_04250 [Acidobacteriota bacterium]